MRVIFVNLQSNEKIVKTLEKYVFGISVSKKHRFFIDYLLSNNVSVCNYVMRNGPYTRNQANRLYRMFYFFRLIEAKIILAKDGLGKVKTVYRLSDIKSDDMLLLYSLKDEYAELEKVHAFKAVSLIHASCGSYMAEKMRKADIQCFYNEANFIQMCQMFQRYYKGMNLPFIVIPFAYAERFKKRKEFKERRNKAIAVGTITYRLDDEFIKEYGNSCLQPIRRMLRDASPQSEEFYDSVISDYGEGAAEKKVQPEDGILKKAFKTLWNRSHVGQQKNYFSFDMVDKLNQYKMCICGEEIIGVPGIGFVEGMACGCAYIGCTKYDYASYGMIEGVHYIGYDGSLDNLKQKIAYYQLHESELENIANNGYEFAKSHFNCEAVAKGLFEKLTELKMKYEELLNDSKKFCQVYGDTTITIN